MIDIQPDEVSGGNSNNCERDAVYANALTEDLAIPAVKAQPTAVIQHRDWSGDAFREGHVWRTDQPPKSRPGSQGGEVFSGDLTQAARISRAVRFDVAQRSSVPGEQAGKDDVILPKLFEHGDGKRVFIRWPIRGDGPEPYQLRGILDRERPQDERIDNTENRYVCANAKRQRGHRDR